MSKNSRKHRPDRAPPRFRRIARGETWRIQKQSGHPVLTGKIGQVTRDTVVITWMDDGAVKVRPGVEPLRWNRADLKFVEKVA